MMSPMFEQALIFVVMSILVTLFTWIYLRDRRREFGLWLLGWSAICIHFAVPLAARFWALPPPLTAWIRVASLIVAGTFFLLSVSEVFRNKQQRAIFIAAIGVPSLLLLAVMVVHFQSVWFYSALLSVSLLWGLHQAIRFYGLKSRYMYAMVVMLVPYAVWSIWQASKGHPEHGLDFYLFGFFGVTGLAYFRRFRRLTPGAVFTSASFIAWGLVFPVSTLLKTHFAGLPPGFFWDLPKYFVAFGMILTLFENQAEASTKAARQYHALFEGNLPGAVLSSLH